jgi:hypothetical protein
MLHNATICMALISDFCDIWGSNGSNHQHYRLVMFRHVVWYIHPSVSDQPAASIFRIYLQWWQRYRGFPWYNTLWWVILLHSVLQQVHSLFAKRVPNQVRSSASFLSLQYPLVSLRTYSSCFHLIPRLPVTSILPCVLHSITCFRRRSYTKCDQSN